MPLGEREREVRGPVKEGSVKVEDLVQSVREMVMISVGLW